MTSTLLSLPSDPRLAASSESMLSAGLLQLHVNRGEPSVGETQSALPVTVDFTQLLTAMPKSRTSPGNMALLSLGRKPALESPATPEPGFADTASPEYVTPAGYFTDGQLPTRCEIEEAVAAVQTCWQTSSLTPAGKPALDLVTTSSENSGPVLGIDEKLTLTVPGEPAAPVRQVFPETPNKVEEQPAVAPQIEIPARAEKDVVGVDLQFPRDSRRAFAVNTIADLPITETPATKPQTTAAPPVPVPRTAYEEPTTKPLVAAQVSNDTTFVSGAGARLESPAEVPVPAGRSSVGVSLAAEIAVLPLAPNEAVSAKKSVEEKIFLSTDAQAVKESQGEAGIAVAKPAHVMPSKATSTQPSADDIPSSMLPAAASEALLADAEMPSPVASPEMRSLARNAVVAIAKVVDSQLALPTASSSSVDLKLRLADEDISIRVEVCDGEVHTSLRTDSAALRAALGQEWHGAVAEVPMRNLRFMDPQISAADRPTSDAASSGGHSSGEQAASRSPADFTDRQPSGSRRAMKSDSVRSEPAHAPVYLNTLHLSTFA